MQCPICYTQIYVGIKQQDCFHCHLICYTCFSNTIHHKCSFCRRSTNIFEIYSNNHIKAIYNDFLPESIDIYYSVLNKSLQQDKCMKELITLEEYEELYHYIHGPIIHLYFMYSCIFAGLSIFLYAIYYINFINPPFIFTRCFYTPYGHRCVLVDHAYVYLTVNACLMLLSGISILISFVFMLYSFRLPKNPFKLLLFKEHKLN